MSESLHPGGRGRKLVLVFFVLSCLSCAPQESPSSGEQISPAAGAVTDLKIVDRAELEAILADLQGKIVLVDFWATWCAPCVEQLPHTLKLASELRNKGFAAITVCMEDPDNLERIQDFLASQNHSEATNLICNEGGSPRAMEAFEITGGALPHYKLYDRQSQLRRTFALDPAAPQQFTQSDIESAVDALLRE